MGNTSRYVSKKRVTVHKFVRINVIRRFRHTLLCPDQLIMLYNVH